jgi:transposase-like protein
MLKELNFNEEKISQWWREVKEDFWGDLKVETRKVLRRLLEGCLEEDMAIQVSALPYERSDKRLDYRNGYYERDLETELGVMEGIKVPRTRGGCFRTRVFERYQRRQAGVNRNLREIFLAGVSTRRVGEVVEPLLGCKPSAQTISEVTKGLDKEVREFHQHSLEDKYLYLILDGIVLKVKGALGVKKKRVLCAYGITKEGKRELINFRQVSAESEAKWEAFLNDLYQRGLKGSFLKLIATDGCTGLHTALDTVYPFVQRQRCWVHKLRNVSNKLPRKYQEECLSGAKKIYQARNRREAVKYFWRWASKWRPLVPDAVKCLEKDLDELLSFFDCPESHRKKVRTTNAIERAFREIRRRTRPMSSFTNDKSCDRIIYALISYFNKKWKSRPLKEFTQLY